MKTVINVLAISGILALNAVYAASVKAQEAPAQIAPVVCKGIPDQASCESIQVFEGISACKWIEGRMTANGSSVKAYCRKSTKSVPQGAKLKSTAQAPSSN